MQELRKCFRDHPVIASIRNDVDFEYALKRFNYSKLQFEEIHLFNFKKRNL